MAAAAAGLTSGGRLGLLAQAAGAAPAVTPGKFTATRTSLQAFTPPEWFADAKFGMWSHWGPQSAIGDGDWYAHWMYVQGHEQNLYHVKRFGPPAKFGYKDTFPLFTADKWDPDHLIDLYSRAGAKYFMSMGVHHDNFDLWDSKYQPRWNAVAAGPRKDIVGLWAAAARRRGLRFGVSEHLSNSFNWLNTSHGSDATGPLAGVPYDGADPAYADLYHDYSGIPLEAVMKAAPMDRTVPERWKQQYLLRVRDLIDKYQPDLLYTDGGIPFAEYGLATVAELYNVGPTDMRGNPQAVYFGKNKECGENLCVLDKEASVFDGISAFPWQIDTCIGKWHYKVGQSYKSAKHVVDLLVDVVSKNGNLMLNFPLPASGELDPEEQKILAGITEWMAVNAEGIFHTRPWTVHGEGPAMAVKLEGIKYNEGKLPLFTAQDVRFTRKGADLFAFVQGWPGSEAVIAALGSGSAQKPQKVVDVRMLGRNAALSFTQGPESLRVTLPAERPSTADTGICLKVAFA